MSEYAVRVRNVNKSFTTRAEDNDGGFLKKRKKITRHVIKNISFDIKKGEVFGIIGRNGSGKSTTLNMISRIMKPDSGTIEINGKVASILELGMGFHNDLSGRENIYIKGTMYGFAKNQLDERIEDIIDYADIGEYINLPMRVYSSGMRSRLAFAIMINVDADIVILDEVLATGDLAFRKKSSTHFMNMKNKGKTIILVAHSMSTMREMCDRVAWLEKGVIREVGIPNVVCGHYETELAESLEIITDLAEAGVPYSQNVLGCMYRDGNKVEKNLDLAIYWFREAIKRSNDPAKINLADLIVSGEVSDDREDALDLYMSAAQRGNRDARTKLSRLLTQKTQDINKELIEGYKELLPSGNPQIYYEYAELLMKSAWNNEDRKEALRWFKKASEYGNMHAMYQVAIMYRDGTGPEQSDSNYLSWLKKAAEHGHANSQFTLGNMYRDGIKVEHDNTEAFYWFKMAADNNHIDAIFQIAIMYREGIGVEKNLDDSDYWLKLYSQHGLYRQINTLADSFSNCKNEVYDPEMGIKWYRVNAEHGYADSNYRLGMLLINGKDEGSKSDAISSFVFAAERNHLLSIAQLFNLHALGEVDNVCRDDLLRKLEVLVTGGNVWAANDIGIIYAGGKTVQPDIDKAIHYIKIIGEAGNANALHRLGMIYRDGVLIKQDFDEAVKWFERGALLGNIHSAMSLVELYAIGNTEENVCKRAIGHIENMCKSGDVFAMKTLGRYYLDGIAVKQNYQKALYWYEVASKLGDPGAIYDLGMIYKHGKGVDMDLKRALELFISSSDRGHIASIIAIMDMYNQDSIDKEYFDVALSRLETLATGGNITAMRNIGDIYYDGRYGINDSMKAKGWFEKASLLGDAHSRRKLENIESLNKP
ncbi:MAG: ATP-binding cassette domain-containing protein [Candidatus Methanomethylophilaceae archaeon]|jgi:TPR repeat protein